MTTSAADTLDELQRVATVLRELHADPVDESLLDQTERAIAFGVAWLASSRAAAAPAVEAAIAGASPRPIPPQARDLLLTVELLIAALARHG